MAYLTISDAPTAFAVRAGSEALGSSTKVLALREGASAVVYYVPRADLDMSKLERSTRQTSCPHKGQCSYYHVHTGAGRLDNAVWSYETPIGAAAAIAGHLAFYPDKVTLTAL